MRESQFQFPEKATNTCKWINTLKLICMETFPVIVLRHILNIIQHNVQTGWKKQQRRPEQPNIQTVTGRKQAARWTLKKLHQWKRQLTWLELAFISQTKL